MSKVICYTSRAMNNTCNARNCGQKIESKKYEDTV